MNDKSKKEKKPDLEMASENAVNMDSNQYTRNQVESVSEQG